MGSQGQLWGASGFEIWGPKLVAEWGVILFGPQDFPAGKDDDGVLPLLIGLHQDSANSSVLLFISKTGICDDVKGVVLPGVS